MIVGERVNTQGSRKIKEFVLADDYDGVLGVARDQVEYGAHALDVCLALTERGDEADQMAIVTKKLAMGIEVPLMFDTLETDALKRGLETYPGRAIINSINMENGRDRIEEYVPIASSTAPRVVALTIDEAGMAKTRDEKLRVARVIHDICVDEYGLAPEDLIFDALTFTLATGDEEWIDSAVETIEGIRLIKRELPGVLTSLGVSNVSFGLSPRARSVAQLDLPAPLRGRRPRHGDGQPDAHDPVHGHRRRGARARRRPRAEPPAGRAAAADLALRLDADGGGDGRLQDRQVRRRVESTSGSTRRSCTASRTASRTTSRRPSTSAARARTTRPSTCSTTCCCPP